MKREQTTYTYKLNITTIAEPLPQLKKTLDIFFFIGTEQHKDPRKCSKFAAGKTPS